MTRTSNEQASARDSIDDRWHRLEHNLKTFAGLVHAPQEGDSAWLAPLRAWRRGGKPLDVDAVGDQHRIVAEVLDDGTASLVTYGNAAANLLEGCLQDPCAADHDPRTAVDSRVEGRNDGAERRPAREHAQARRR